MSKNNSNETKDKQKINLENPETEIIDNIDEAAEDGTESTENVEQEEMSEIDRLAKELGEEKAKLEKEKKEYLFLMAEIIRNASESVLKGLLPIVDDFERGLDAIKDSSDAESVKEGMTLIYNKLMKFLESNQVKPIESTGADFDPELHEAIAMVPVEDESMKGKVIDTPTKGYTINDKVLRYAKVAVGQ